MSDSQTELRAAIAGGDLAAVEAALEAGASPLADSDSLLRLAHAHLEGPAGRDVFQRVRRATREAAAARDGGGSLGSSGPAQPVRAATGARLDVLCARCEVKVAARALAKLVSAPRREADVASRAIEDAARLLFVAQRRGSEWTVIPCVFEEGSPWSVEEVPELPARGDGVAPLARALAAEAQCEVLHVEHDALTEYAAHGAIVRVSLADEYGAEPEPADRPSRVDAALAARGVSLSAMRVRTDGHDVRLEVSEPEVMVRVDAVVLQELGEPAVDRRLGVSTAPAMVAPGGQRPLAHAPPPVVEAAQPAPSQQPAAAPPPLVTGPVVPASAPPASAQPMQVASAPPPIVSPGQVQENDPEQLPEPSEPAPPPTVSGAPPLTHDVPPMVKPTEND